MQEVRQRKRDIVASFREGSRRHIVDGGAEIIMGEARFTSPRSVEIRLVDGGTCSIEADVIFLPDEPYAFGQRITVDRPGPFRLREYVRLQLLRTRIQANPSDLDAPARRPQARSLSRR